ncbi:MAG: hypothetical protein Q9163_002797 [Psora crenata]
MYYDLNVQYTSNKAELQGTLAFLAELGYSTVALNHTITGNVPADITNQIPKTLSFDLPPKLKILRRCTLVHSDPSQNYRLSILSSIYDVVAVRPMTEKALQQACHSLECDIISPDFGVRYPFYFQIKTVKSALDRGIKFEICYGPGIMNADGGASRRNLISNATQLIRATRGRGIILSSEAKTALACRGPADIINLALTWGLHQDRGAEAVGREARSVVVQSQMKRNSFRGVIDVVYGGEVSSKPVHNKSDEGKQSKGKRKAEVLHNDPAVVEASPKPASKGEQKRQAKKARQEAIKAREDTMDETSADDILQQNTLPLGQLTNGGIG